MEPEEPYGPIKSVASGGIRELFGSQTSASPKITTPVDETEPVEFQMLVDRSFADQEALVQRRSNYWGFEAVRSFAYDALKSDVPLTSLASVSAEIPELPSRIVQRNLEAVRSRKSLRQMRDEGGRRMPGKEDEVGEP